MQAIKQIPDEILDQGDEATQIWLSSKLGNYKDIFSSPEISPAGEVIGCASAIGLAIVLNFPAFKVLKIKKALQAAGGATTFVKSFMHVYKNARAAGKAWKAAVTEGVQVAARDAGPEAIEALISVFSLGVVYSECFE
ncbi:MAG: hypothetical protein ACRDAX_03640 [Propionibacteriaceae bacterium]